MFSRNMVQYFCYTTRQRILYVDQVIGVIGRFIITLRRQKKRNNVRSEFSFILKSLDPKTEHEESYLFQRSISLHRPMHQPDLLHTENTSLTETRNIVSGTVVYGQISCRYCTQNSSKNYRVL